MQDIEPINIEPRQTPFCPSCGIQLWIVRQQIRRSSDLKRVDGFGDLVVEAPDPNLYEQALLLECKHCEALYQPQAGLFATEELEQGKPVEIEAYAEGQQMVIEDVLTEKVSGFEDGFNWLARVGNDAEWEF